MFGTLFQMRPKAGMRDAIIAHIVEGELQGRETPEGYVAGYVIDGQGGTLWGLAVFDDEATYRATADDPEQDRWYQQLREMLEADPEWHDGAIHLQRTGD